MRGARAPADGSGDPTNPAAFRRGCLRAARLRVPWLSANSKYNACVWFYQVCLGVCRGRIGRFEPGRRCGILARVKPVTARLSGVFIE